MKTFFSLSILFFSFKAFSQDSIIMHSGQVIAGKVSEITQTEVKYRKPSNPDGPMYVINKSDVSVIEYKNGSKDVFSQNNTAANSNSSNTQQQPVQNNYYTTPAPRPSVNVVVAPPVIAPPVIGFGGYYPWGGFYRPYPRFYGGYGYGYHGYGGGYHGYYHPHHHW